MTYDTLSQAINELRDKGYRYDFNLRADGIECKALNAIYKTEQFFIDKIFRFEGDSNPDDSSILYAIQVGDSDVKGLLVDAYGTYADPLNADMIEKLRYRPGN